jgi:hypothetical protein
MRSDAPDCFILFQLSDMFLATGSRSNGREKKKGRCSPRARVPASYSDEAPVVFGDDKGVDDV